MTPSAGDAGRIEQPMSDYLPHIPKPTGAAAVEAEKVRQAICEKLKRGEIRRRDVCRMLRCTAAALNEFLATPLAK